MNKFMMSVVGLLLTVGAQAQWSNKGIKFQAKIKYVSNGELLNLSGASVNVRILSPNDCVLWEENHASQNITNGYLSLVVGSGTTQGAHPAGTTLKAVFDNTTNRSGLVCVDGTNAPTANTAYHPMANDTRKVRISFNNGVDSVLADFSLRASGYALNSETLDGKSVSDFVLKAATAWPATCASGEFVSSVSATGAVTCSPIGAVAGAVSSVAGRTGAVTLTTSDISGLGSAALMGVGTVAGTVAAGNDVRFTQLNGVAVSATAPTTNQVLQFNGTQYVPVALPSAPVTSVSGRTGAVTLTTSDIFGLGGSSVLNVGTAAGTVAAGDDARFTKLNGVAVSTTAPSANGQVLTWNNTTSQWEPAALPATSVPVTSVAGRTGAIVLSNADISGLGGAATLNVGTATGTVAAGDDARFTKINGVAVSATAPTTNQVLQYNGTQYVPVALPSAPVTTVAGRTGAIVLSSTDVSGLGGAAILNVGTTAGTVAAGDDSRVTGALQNSAFNAYVGSASCTSSQSMYWNSVSSQFLCQNITVASSTSFSGSLVGDVTGTQGATSVEKIRGVVVSATTPTANQILQYNGTQYVPVNLPSAPVTTVAGRTGAIVLTNADISGLGGAAILNVGTAASTVAAGNDSRITGALQSSTFNSAVASANCTTSQTMYWNSVSSQFLCQTISVASSTNFSGSLVGDVTGTQAATVVGKIRGVAVAATAPTANQVLQYDGSQYVPTSLPADAVTSVAGKTGVVTLASTDISGLGDSATLNVGNTAGTVAAGNDPRFLPAGTNAGDMLYYNGTAWTSDPFMTRKMSRKITDFSGTAVPAGLTTSATSGTCNANAAAYAGYFGALRCSTGTTTTGWTSVNNGNSEIKTGKAIFHKQTIVIPTLSVNGQRFNVRAGLSSAGNVGNADPATGVYLRYSDSVNGGRFQCVSRNASAESAVDTGVTVAAGAIYEIEMRINAAANQVTCFVNGVAAGTITTNVPVTSSSMGLFTNIQKTAGTTTLYVDVLDWETVIVK